MKMNAPFCGIAILLLLCLPTASYTEPLPATTEYELAAEHGDFSALRDLMESMMDLYVPALKAKLLSIEKKFKDMTQFSGTIYLEGDKAISPPKISGEASVSNKRGKEEHPLVNWSIKTSLDFGSGAVGMELWKEASFGRISFSNEFEQDFSDEFEYRSLLKLEKKF